MGERKEAEKEDAAAHHMGTQVDWVFHWPFYTLRWVVCLLLSLSFFFFFF